MSAKLLLASALILGLLNPAPVSQAQDRTATFPDGRRLCVTPIRYRIGALDPRFGITRERFQRAVEDAGRLWEAAAGRTLFSADDRGALKIDLVYDSRQETTQRLIAARARISEKLKEADLLKEQFVPLQARLRMLDDTYSGQLASFQQDLAAYNKRVTQWNMKGGAPEGEQQSLGSESLTLRKRGALVDAKRQELNALVGDVNVLVRKHNALLDRANAEANALNQSVPSGIEFEEGRYTRQAGEERIQVFQYDGEPALVVILAHEMGHALGIRHNANPSSVMSPLVHAKSPVLTDDDRDGLRAACPARP